MPAFDAANIFRCPIHGTEYSATCGDCNKALDSYAAEMVRTSIPSPEEFDAYLQKLYADQEIERAARVPVLIPRGQPVIENADFRDGPISALSFLPPLGRYVLCHYTGGNWHDSEDDEGRNWVVAKRDECQIYGNDVAPYRWNTLGPLSMFADDVDMWMEFPRATTCTACKGIDCDGDEIIAEDGAGDEIAPCPECHGRGTIWS